MIQSLHINELSAAQVARLGDELSHGEEGNLRSDLAYYRANEALAAADDVIAHVAFDAGVIVGWCLQYLCDDTKRSPLDVGVFVDESRRREGIGSRLLERAISHAAGRPVYAFPDDVVGQAFFANFDVKVH